MDTRQCNRLKQLNRVLILALTLTGLLLDGLQLADLPCGIALVVWLWLPQCLRLEAQLLRHIQTRHEHAGGRTLLHP